MVWLRRLPVGTFEFDKSELRHFPWGVERERARDAARERSIHHEIQRAEAGQLVAHDLAAHDRRKMRAHPFGGDVLGEIGIVA